jgi:hypothetical protein
MKTIHRFKASWPYFIALCTAFTLLVCTPSHSPAEEIYFESNLRAGQILKVKTGMTFEEARSLYTIEPCKKYAKMNNCYRVSDDISIMPTYHYVIEAKKGQKLVITKEDIDKYDEHMGTKHPFEDRFVMEVSYGIRKEIFLIDANFTCDHGADVSARIFDWYARVYGRPPQEDIYTSGVFQRWTWKSTYIEFEVSRRDDQLYYRLSVKEDIAGKYRDVALEKEKSGDYADAIKLYTRVIDIDMLSYKEGLYIVYIRRGVCRKVQGDLQQAQSDYETALHLQPDNPRAYNYLAWLLATHPDGRIRDGKYAVEVAEKMVSILTKPVPAAIDTLAAAYAEAGRFEDAIATQQKAIALLQGQGKDADIADYTKRLKSYQSHKPWRET